MNEMGAGWVTQSDYTNIFVPTFNFNNPKFHQCPANAQKIGVVLNGVGQCKANMIELKKKILKLFTLSIDEQAFQVLPDEFIEAIKI